MTGDRRERSMEPMSDRLDGGRLSVRVDPATWETLEELKGLGVNVSALVREMLEVTRPAFHGMVKAIRARQQGVKLDVGQFVGEIAGEVTRKLFQQER